LEITEEMRWGVMPARFAAARAKLVQVNDTSVPLVMSHGYCAGRNPWQANSEDFTNAQYFANFKANVGHDAFALMVADFSDSLNAFSGVGHSQGGIVFLHLHNYYWTGLSVTTQGRRIQSMGSPWAGCTGAGSAANLIKIFGMGCGANSDLAVDGSRLWLAGISAAARVDVYYYTTTYKLGNLFGDWCNLAVNLILEWPNDGTAELDYCQLSGGNNLGNTQKECHTIDMGYPPGYDNAARNAIINTNRGH